MKTVLMSLIAALLFNVISTAYANLMNIYNYLILIQGGVVAVLEPENGYKPTESELETALAMIESRLNEMGIVECYVAANSQSGCIDVRFPWKSGDANFDPEKIIAKLCEKAVLTFVDPDGNVVLDGSHITKCVSNRDLINHSGYEVELTFDSEGTKLFADATERLIGQKIKICLDGREISSPTVEESIHDGRCVINYIDTAKEAVTMADKIAAGALPFTLIASGVAVFNPAVGTTVPAH